MLTNLDEAPKNKFWQVCQILDLSLVHRLRKLGVDEGTWLMPMADTDKTMPVRVKVQDRELLLPPGMALKIVMHDDANRKLSLAEIPAGQSGHLEGITGGHELQECLQALGLEADTEFTVVRRVPPMNYIARNKQGRTVRLTEGMAAKILGEMQGQKIQFSMSGRGREFKVIKMLGSARVVSALQSLGVQEGDVLILDHVEPGCQACNSLDGRVRLATKEGMHFYLSTDMASKIMVDNAEDGPK